MAKLDSIFGFTGTIGDFTAYRVPDVDGIIVRRRGGVPAQEIRFSPRFENSRRVNAEFGGRSTATRYLNRVLRPIAGLADYRFSGTLNGLLRPVQKLDKISPFGQRQVALSRYPSILDGFSLNKRRMFDQTLRAPLQYRIMRDRLTAEVDLPEVSPHINFSWPGKASHFRFILAFGIVPDILCSDGKYAPSSKEFDGYPPVEMKTPWCHTAKGSAPETVSLIISTAPPDDQFTLLLAVGIQFGSVIGPEEIEPLKRSGTARVLCVA